MLTRMFLIAVLVAGGCLGQSEPAKAAGRPAAERKYFHLEFVVKELENNKIVNARAYSMTVAVGLERSSIRSGNKLAVPSSPRSTTPATQGNAQFSYIDVGTNIDCWSAEMIEGQLALSVTADISTAADASDGPAPTLRQVKWNSPVIVPLKKPTVIFSSDDPSSKRQMQLELTASPMN